MPSYVPPGYGGIFNSPARQPYVPPGYDGIINSPVNNGGGLNPDGSVPPPYERPFIIEPPPPVRMVREYGKFRKISSRKGPEYQPSKTPELIRRAAQKRLRLE